MADNTYSATDGYGLLGELPAELRNEVYSHALVAPGPITVIRAQRTKAMRENDEYFDGGDFLLRTEVAVQRGKRKRTLSVSRALGLGLFGVSKAIRQEATPTLYYGNHFAFTTKEAAFVFRFRIGSKDRYLSRLSLLANAMGNWGWGHLDYLNVMIKPEYLNFPATVLTAYGDCHDLDAERTAARTWRDVKQIVAVRETWAPLRGTLYFPREEQLERLKAFRFRLPEGVTFDGVKVKDESERDGRFMAFMRTCLERDYARQKGEDVA